MSRAHDAHGFVFRIVWNVRTLVHNGLALRVRVRVRVRVRIKVRVRVEG